MPAAWASAGVSKWTGSASSHIAPASRWYAPVMIFTSVDLPAPFSPTSAWISPARSSKSTPSRARAPANRLTMPSMRRRGSPVIARSATLIRVRDELCRVASVEETVGEQDCRRDLLTPAYLLDDVEGERTESGIALHGGPKFPARDRLERRTLAVDRDDRHVDARLDPGRLEGLDCPQRHLVVVRVDGRDLATLRLHDVQHGLLARRPGEIARLRRDDLHPRVPGERLPEAFRPIHRDR